MVQRFLTSSFRPLGVPGIGTIAGAVFLVGLIAGSETATAEPQRAWTQSEYLLLDPALLDRGDNVRLVPGPVVKDPRNPLLVEDKPWEPRFDNMYANVLFDEDEQVYKCWYSPFIVDEATTGTPPEKRKSIPYLQALRGRKREMGVCYAVSKDGITWTKPELGLVEFNGSTRNNIVIRGPHGAGVRKDPHDPDPSRRYKMFCKRSEGGSMAVAFSPDGLHWSEPVACPGIDAAGDTHNNFFWDETLHRYIGITRLWADGQRVVGRTESRGFRTWSKAVEVFRANREQQTYAMPVFRYGNGYFGLTMLLDTRQDTVDCELSRSRDTVRWERLCPGVPLIRRGPEGSFDSGCIYAAAYPIFCGEEIRLYYSGGNDTHGSWRATGLGLARLRRDRFAGMEPRRPTELGRIVTKPVRCTGAALRVNADARGGSLRVAVLDAEGFDLDACRPITNDVTDATVVWRSHQTLEAFKDKAIRLRFELKSARLYGFSFDNDGRAEK